MQALSPAIDVYPVQHLPLIKAYADPLGLVSLLNHAVPTAMEVDAGTVGLAMGLATLSGHSPWYRLEEVCAQHDTALLFGTTVPPPALNAATAGRGLDRLYDFGPMRRCTAWAVRAAMRVGLERRSVHFDPTSRRGWGDDQCAETQDLPFQGPQGQSKAKRPDLKPCVLSTLCVDRAVPLWGKPEDGHASDQTLHTTRRAEVAQLLAPYGGQPGAYSYIADAALVTADSLAALRDPLGMTRLPATYSAGGQVIAEAVAGNDWEVGGGLAQTPPPPHRPGTFQKVAEARGTLDGKAQRAVGVHSSSQEQRRQQPLERERRASDAPLEASVPAVARQAYCWQADAEAAAAKRRALPSAQHWGDVEVQERPRYGPGRPRFKPPRVVQARRYGRQVTRHERAEVMARKTQEAGCCVLLPNGPTAGAMAHKAGDVLRAYKEQHGIEQNDGFLQEPLIVNSLLLKKPERIAALGLVLVLALLRGRLVERALRVHVETTGKPVTGWDKQATQKPTACMLMAQFAGVMGIKVGGQRQLAPPCRQSHSSPSWHCVSRLPISPRPRVDNEPMRPLAGATRLLAARGG